MINDIFRSFFRTIGRILAYIAIGLIIAYFSGIVKPANVKAAILAGCIDSGTSLKGKAKIGTKYVGSNYYYTWNSGDYEKSYITLDFCTDVDYSTFNSSEITGKRLVYFTVDYCSNFPPNNPPILNIWSGYQNYVDFSYQLDTSIYLGNEEWTRAACMRSFIRLYLNYEDNISADSYTDLTYYTTSNIIQFGLYSNYGYGSIVRYTDLTYYNQSDYNDKLLNAKTYVKNQETNSKIDSTNSKIDESNETGKGILGKVKEIFTAIIDLPKKIIDLMIEGLKSLFIPDNTDFITNFVDSLENKLGLIAEVPIAIIEFGLNLVNCSWESVTSIFLPSIEIFGYNFWNAQEIDISQGLAVFQPFKYITDCICVLICCRTLVRWRENFSGGGS